MRIIFESLFDISYILIAIILGFRILRKSKPGSGSKYFGYMTLILVFGDMFHLVPRVYGFIFDTSEFVIMARGYGKMVTSITMTIFYLVLYFYWRKRYNISGYKKYTVAMISLSIIRIVLSLMPANQWALEHASYQWGIYRNVPFIFIGIIMIYLFFRTRDKITSDPLKKMWIAILLSFLFYLPVILFVDAVPMIGMLMIPKTIAYVWVIVMGLKTVGEENKHIEEVKQ